ncbi:MAG: prephenate dehydratase, partial [Anaerolineaceae bacterium]|nr:prephenate dehydratase [Anaerolineaceae bacterium]
MRVAFQGEPGAYSEAAALEYFGKHIQSVPCESFDVVFDRVLAGECEFGIIPIENSLAGSIHRNYDLLLQNELYIVGERYLRISHCLIAQPGVRVEDLRRVISHPQALAQCERFLRSLSEVRTEPAYDTAGSAKQIREQGWRDTAAVASRRAAEVYGMSVLAEAIEDNPANYTRFLVIARSPVAGGPDAKTSIVFTANNVPGSLFKALSVFALRDIDLTKIESRPLVGKLWEYLFYIDFNGASEEPQVKRAL